jgi:hypothetical protein
VTGYINRNLCGPMDRIANQLTIVSPWSIESMWLLMDESIEKKGTSEPEPTKLGQTRIGAA